MAGHSDEAESDISGAPGLGSMASEQGSAGPLPFVLGLLWLESALFWAFAAQRLDLSTYISVHLGLCAVTATFGGLWVKVTLTGQDAGDSAVMLLQLVVWTLLGGPFGTLTAVALLVPQRTAAGCSAAEPTTAATRPSELTRLELLHGLLLDRRLRLEHSHTIQPLLDVIIEGTQTEKLDALSLVSKYYTPSLAPALKRALGDKDASVRVLAATVTAQQHNAYTKQIGALHAIASEAPESPNRWRELAQAHSDYARSGLLEASRAEAEANHALAHLARAKELDPGSALAPAQISPAGWSDALGGQAAVAASELCDVDQY